MKYLTLHKLIENLRLLIKTKYCILLKYISFDYEKNILKDVNHSFPVSLSTAPPHSPNITTAILFHALFLGMIFENVLGHHFLTWFLTEAQVVEN